MTGCSRAARALPLFYVNTPVAIVYTEASDTLFITMTRILGLCWAYDYERTPALAGSDHPSRSSPALARCKMSQPDFRSHPLQTSQTSRDELCREFWPISPYRGASIGDDRLRTSPNYATLELANE